MLCCSTFPHIHLTIEKLVSNLLSVIVQVVQALLCILFVEHLPHVEEVLQCWKYLWVEICLNILAVPENIGIQDVKQQDRIVGDQCSSRLTEQGWMGNILFLADGHYFLYNVITILFGGVISAV